MESMRVLIVRNAYSYDFGGAERLAVELGAELVSNSIGVTIASRQPRLLKYARERKVPSLRGWWWSRQNWSGTNQLLLPFYGIWLILLFMWYVTLLLKKHPDALHLMSKDDFIAGTLAGRLFGRRVVWTDCADLKYLYRNNDIWYKNPIGKTVYRISKLAHAVIVVSNSEKKLIETALGHKTPSNYIVIYSTVCDMPVKPFTHKKNVGDVIFCSTSRLVEAKGIQDLISAFTAVSRQNKTCKLWIVGDGPDEAKFKKSASNNNSVTFWGHQDAPLPLLAAADVYVHPSHHEGFSLSLAEAAMLGKPLIATKTGGNPEIVNDSNGLLFEVQNIDELILAIQILAQDATLRKRLGNKARKDFQSLFDFRHVVKDQYVSLYEK